MCDLCSDKLRRAFQKHNIKPAFAFGHGLSYGRQALSRLKISGRTIAFSVAGTGCETPQIYIGYPTAATHPDVPTKVLRYFKKTCSASAELSYTLTDRDVSEWDVAAKAWRVVPGKFAVFVGVSSQDIALAGSLTVTP
jgi:beta-glucosidase